MSYNIIILNSITKRNTPVELENKTHHKSANINCCIMNV